jgi:hypothetical protein
MKVSFMHWLSAGLSCILFYQSAVPLPAQTPPKPKLNIVIVEGQAGINNIRQRSGRDVIVQVEDENDKPVAGIAVTFTLPSRGPTGVLPNGSNTMTVLTGDDGRAAMRGLRPNGSAGQFQIHVNASRNGETARASVTQFNMVVPDASKTGGGSGKLIAILVLAGAAAAGGAAYVGLNRNSSAAPPPPIAGPQPIGITPGTGSMGPPQ